MNVASASFLILFAVLGAVIAYFADRLGRNLGKKRLSLFGLRPRHTAELLTVAAGAIIPIFTILVVMALSGPVREWLLNGPYLLQQRDNARRDFSNAVKQRDQKVAEVKQLNASIDSLRASNTTLNAQELTLRQDVNKLKPQVNSLNVQLVSKTNQLNQRTSELKLARADLSKVRDEMAPIKKNLVAVQAELVQKQSQLKDKQAQVVKLEATYSDLDKQYQGLETRYATLQQDELKLRAQVNELNGQVTSLTSQKNLIDAQLTATQNQYAQAQTLLDKTSRTLEATNKNLENSSSLVAESRMVPVIFNIHDELARAFVPAEASEGEARDIISQLIKSASAQAEARGAEKNSSGLSAGLVDLPVEGGKWINARELENQTIEHITHNPEPLLLVANAFYNTSQGEFVPLVFSVYGNPLIYRRGETIADTMIQGSMDQQQILQQLAQFGKEVQQKVQQGKGKTEKLVPVAGRDESYGEVPPSEVFNLVEKIHNWGRTAHLYAMASQDTRAGDRLVLKFDLRQ